MPLTTREPRPAPLIKRLIATLATFAAVLALAACTAAGDGSTTPQPNPCLRRTDSYAIVSIEGMRLYNPQLPPSDENRYFDPALSVLIVLDAVSHDPDYRGSVAWTRETGPILGMGVSGVNPIEMTKTTPFDIDVCWPPDKAVRVSVRAYIVVPQQDRDRLRCEIEDANNLHIDGFDYMDQYERQIGLADMVGYQGANPTFGVQCQFTSIPNNYSGPGVDPLPGDHIPPGRR